MRKAIELCLIFALMAVSSMAQDRDVWTHEDQTDPNPLIIVNNQNGGSDVDVIATITNKGMEPVLVGFTFDPNGSLEEAQAIEPGESQRLVTWLPEGANYAVSGYGGEWQLADVVLGDGDEGNGDTWSNTSRSCPDDEVQIIFTNNGRNGIDVTVTVNNSGSCPVAVYAAEDTSFIPRDVFQVPAEKKQRVRTYVPRGESLIVTCDATEGTCGWTASNMSP